MNGANKEFRFAYVIEHEAIGTATTTTKGIVMGSTANGKIFVETDGTMSLNGYDNIINSLGNKVDKVTGKDLSTNDYTNADKTKVGILTSTGTGNMYLADDGTYKTITIPDSGVQDVKVNGTSIVDSTGSADLHTIALSGSYNDLTNKPQNLVQDANYVHTDNNFTDDLFARVSVIDRTGLGNKALMDDANYRALADVAFSGSYNDLTNLPTNLVQDASYVHTDNNFTTTLKTKLENIDPTGEENIIESISLNGSTLTVDSNKNVDIDISNYALEADIPTRTSDLTNDSNFAVDASYVHTDNNFTTALKDKLTALDPDGEENIIEVVKVSGNPLVVQDKAVNIDLTAYRTSDQITDMITDAISGVTQFDYKIVTTLPATGEKGTFYLVAVDDPAQRNVYEEYLYINNNWELVGTTKVDLSGYLPLSGGTMTGTINTTHLIPKTNVTYGLGNNSHIYDYAYINSIELGGKAISDGGYIDFHFNKDTSDFTSRIIENSSGVLDVNSTAKFNKSTGMTEFYAGNVVLNKSNKNPDDSTINQFLSIYGGGSDYVKLEAMATGTDNGHFRLYTGDNGNEPLYFGQMGASNTIAALGYLLNKSHNTILPGSLGLAAGTTPDTPPATIQYNSTDHCLEFLVS